MLKPATRNILSIFFLIALTVTGFFVAAAYKNFRQTQIQNRRAAQSQAFTRQLEAVHEHAEIYNNTQRDYLLTANRIWLNWIRWEEDSLRQDIRNLAAFAAADSSQKKAVNTLITAIERVISEGTAQRKILETGGEKAIRDQLYRSGNMITVDELNTEIRRQEIRNHAVINSAHQYLEKIAQKTTYRFFLLALVFLMILTYFLYNLASDFRKNARVAAQLRYQASLINSIPDAILTTDRQFRVKSWNRFAAELYGITENDALGKSISQLFSIENSGNWQEHLQQLQEQGSFRDEYRIRKLNGDTIVVMASVNTILSPEGNITGYVAVHRDITERKKLEEHQQRFSEELASQVKIKTAEVVNLVERITDGFLAMDSSFTFTYVNARAGEMLGYEPAALTGRNIFADFPQTISESFNEACREAFSTQQFVFLENYYAPLGRWLENSIYPSPDGLSVFFKDITSRKKTESALKDSEERYRHLIEHIHAGVVVHRPDSSILLYNQEAARLLYFPEQGGTPRPLGEEDWFLVNEEGQRMLFENYPVMQVIRHREPISNLLCGIENPQARTLTWVLVNAYPEWDEHHELKEVVVTFVDISSRIKAEEELKRSEDNLNMAQQLARIGSWEFDLQSQQLTWSKELYRIFEFEEIPEEELYIRYRSKFHPDDLAKLDSMISHALETKTGYTYQHRIINNDGSIKHILGIGDVITNRQGEVTGLKGTGQDITDLVKAEEKLQHSYKQIRELVAHLQHIREQERTRIAREIHDELGQQLTGLKMYVSWLNKKTDPARPEVRDKFEAAMALIEDTIRSVRRISMELRPSMLDDLGLIAALEWQSTEFEKRSGILTEFINHAGNFDIPSQVKTGLFRIYQESLTNVARHAGAKRISASLELHRNELVLTISDDGVGFAFSHVESKKTLGLFGMKERTQEMGGRYDIISEPGNGTTVRVSVPLKNHQEKWQT